MRLLRVDGIAVGIDADVGSSGTAACRNLQHLPPMKLVTVSRLRHIAESGVPLVGLRAHATLDLDQVVERQITAVVRLLLAAGEMAGHAETLGLVGDLGRHLEQQRVGALAETRPPGSCSPGLAFSSAAASSTSACAAPVSPQLACRGRSTACRPQCPPPWLPRWRRFGKRRRHAEMRHVGGPQSRPARRQRLITGGTIRHVAGIADPALLPLVVVLVVDRAE